MAADALAATGEGSGWIGPSEPGAADPATGTAVVRLRLSTFVPVGAVVQAAIEAFTAKDVVLVPVAALVRHGDGVSVFVVGADGKAQRREVTLGLESEDEAAVSSGVAAGDRVVVKGQQGLPDGASVTVAEE